MSEILYINACLRQNSRTKRLGDSVLKRLGGSVAEVNLYGMDLSPLTVDVMIKRDMGDFSDARFELAKQFAKADTIVISAPYWDLSFPAVLKLYLENVSVVGITFKYSDDGMPIGLCSAKKLIYVTTAGGFIGENDFGFSYVRSLAQNLYGIKDAECIAVEGLDIAPDRAEDILADAISNIN